MRGSVAKRMRQYVRDTYKFMNEDTLYKRDVRGNIVISPACHRGVYRYMKKNFKRG
jgi:metal-dependent hydrolase (beta-lactamase superfamily II)